MFRKLIVVLLLKLRQLAAMDMHPKHLAISDYTYHLPEEKIAKYPLATRDLARLLVYKDESIRESLYKEIAEYIPPNSLIILNDTKVIEARILFQKSTGAVIEIFCLEPVGGMDIANAMSQVGRATWLCLIGGASKWKPGQVLRKEISTTAHNLVLEAKFVSKVQNRFAIELSWTPVSLSFADVLHLAGSVPLPPYLKRDVEKADSERYQTVYANAKGSVAAPTAGLHFTTDVLQNIRERNIHVEHVTLHVGAGTFKPVTANKMEDHDMHAEFIEVAFSTIENILHYHGSFITAVGTTSLRTIESLYWMGVKLSANKNITEEELIVRQWDPYELTKKNLTVKYALECLLDWMTIHQRSKLVTKTQILIAPGYTIRIADALITNFHQPRSTLLLLIAAFIGESWRKLYQYALENNVRFLSYGDGCMLFRNRPFL